MSSAAAPVERRVARPSGWWGMAVFVATEATFFGTLIGSYFYLRFHAVEWPPAGVPKPHLALPLVLTGVLVADEPAGLVRTLLCAARARRPGSGGAARRARRPGGLPGDAAPSRTCTTCTSSARGTRAYGSIYFTLLGAHHLHVLLAVLLEAWFVLRLASGVTRYRLVGLSATAFYVYFVNVLALVVVGVQLSAAA